MNLKDVYAPYFKIGTSVSGKNMKSWRARRELKKHYNSFTAENEMKPLHILDWKENLEHPEQYRLEPALNFDRARKYLDFARKHKIALRGHALVWHNQTPRWFFKEQYSKEEDAPLADKETMLARMESYIKGVLEFVQKEYPDVIYVWDTVNEAMEENEADGWRKKSLWYQTVGEEFVVYAFRFARKYAAPGVKLFYNDYNSFNPFKQEKITELVLKPLMEEHLIDGMGMQSHLVLGYTDLDRYEEALHHYGATGLEIQITELDIHNNDPSEIGMQALAEVYGKLFEILTRAKDEGKANITSVTFWGMKDDESWLTGFRKEQSYPLLFGKGYKKKAAYREVIKVQQQR